MQNVVEQSGERIEQAATELFADHGFDSVGVREIARRANVPVSAISYYFGSKEALYRECARKLVGEYLAEAKVEIDRGAGSKQVLAHFQDFANRNSRLIKMWLDLQLSGEAEGQAYAQQEIMEPVWRLVEKAVASDRESTLERRLEVLSFVGGVILNAILTDPQMVMLTGANSDEARETWQRGMLDRVAGARVRAAAANGAS